ncbi:MAG: GNAT family protein [Candidatus Woesearchaeota archaeon]|nr:GNAT family protein [Candidatus Woesearchaeota archaeon]
MKEIRTERTILKELRPEDVTQTYADALNDPEVVMWTEARFSRWSLDKARDYVAENGIEKGSLLIGIFIKGKDGSEKHIGNIRFSSFAKNHNRCYVGIMVFDRAEWGKGYASEALKAAVKYAFKELKLHKIIADYYAINKSSGKVFEKCGFRKEADLKGQFFIEGRYVDGVGVAIINPSERSSKK